MSPRFFPGEDRDCVVDYTTLKIWEHDKLITVFFCYYHRSFSKFFENTLRKRFKTSKIVFNAKEEMCWKPRARSTVRKAKDAAQFSHVLSDFHLLFSHR